MMSTLTVELSDLTLSHSTSGHDDASTSGHHHFDASPSPPGPVSLDHMQKFTPAHLHGLSYDAVIQAESKKRKAEGARYSVQ